MAEQLRYLGPEHRPRDLADHALERVSLLPAGKIETMGTEEQIPLYGPLMCLFIPYSEIEPQFIDYAIRKRGRQPPVWVVKMEDKDLPYFLRGDRRLIYVDREQPGIEFYNLTQ